VFPSLRAFFRRGSVGESAQLALELDGPPPVPRNADEFLTRLRALGLRRIERCRLTSNRNVMVSFRGAELRVHRGFLDAPADIHLAIVAFVEGRTRAERRVAQRRIISHRIDEQLPARPPRRERTRAEDEPFAAKLSEWHAKYNAELFDGALKAVPVRVSRRMKSRLGHYTASTPESGGEIAISYRHLRRHGWTEALHTLLHEMVHQWQDETGHPLDHGPGFRAKAREVGIAPRAKRGVSRG
jgi:hypothetical protein